MSKLNDNVLQQIDSRFLTLPKRYNEVDGVIKRRRKDPLLQAAEEEIIEDFTSKNTFEE